MTLGIVIPVYHGSETIAAVVEALERYAESRRMPCRVALVADGGGEADYAAVRALAKRYHGVTAVTFFSNRGQQQALYAGIRKLGDCDLIATMDDDGAHPVQLLDSMIEAVSRGADLCYAVAGREGTGLMRRAGALCRDALFALCLHMPRGTRPGAYRVMTGELARRLAPEPDGTIYLSAAAMRLRPTVACIHYQARPGAPSRYTIGKLWRLYRGLLTHYTPLKRLVHAHARVKNERCAVVQGRGSLWEG